MERTSIPIVIVARNCIALTKKAVKSALDQNVPVDVLVIDNASTDGTAQWLATRPVATMHTGEQWALAKCWNVALKSLWKLGYDRALVLNNDLKIHPSTVRTLDSMGLPFVTCVSVNTEEQFVEGTANIPSREELLAGARPHPDYSCWLMRREVTDAGCWFNEECYPAYCEDSFHHKKMHDASIDAMCVSLPFLHYGASTLKDSNPAEARKIREGADRNRLLFKKAYGCLPGGPGYEELFQR